MGKKQNTFFRICLELFDTYNYFNLAKIFVLRLFKMAANQTECFTLEQRSVIKFLLVEKGKPCEIYRRMFTETHVLLEICLQIG